LLEVKIYQLSDIGKSLQNMIEKHYQSGFWIKAEISKLNFYPKTGHCFPDLVERKDGKIKAQMRSIIWSTHYQKIGKSFLQIAKTPLEDGMNILFRAKLSYHQTYGFSLQILRIDPKFTLGELAVEKEKSIQQLQQENLFYKNRNLATPLLIKRLAIISYNTSKGYADFLNIVNQYKEQFNLSYQLFPSLLQGDKAEKQLIEQLQLIEKRKGAFDAICIIRGGGGEVGMNCYNSFQVAKTLAEMSLPVYTGIGHSTNETVCEMIAHKNCITPTDFAYEVIQKFKDYKLRIEVAQQDMFNLVEAHFSSEANYLVQLSMSLQKQVKNLVRFQNQQLSQLSHQIQTESPKVIRKANFKLKHIQSGIKRQPMFAIQVAQQHIAHQQQLLQIWSRKTLAEENQLLTYQSQRVKYLSPKSVLSRGYSLILKKGKIVTDISKLKKGDEIQNISSHGKVNSIIKNIETNAEDEIQ
jgi:exodeoxyribonuclease VII large subunit